MNKILVPTDLSPIAEIGLKLAVEIAKKCGATISLVNFTKHPYGATFSPSGDVAMKSDPEGDLFAIAMLKKTHSKLEELVVQYGTGDFQMETAVLDDEFKNGIDEYLQVENIDLVVMGTSGEENARETFSGNHTEQTIRVSACPVLSVRDGFERSHFNTIVVAADVISDNKLAEGLKAIKMIADCFDSEIHLVHIRDNSSESDVVPEAYFNQIAQIAGLAKHKVIILEHSDIVDSLINYGEQVQAGLIAIIKNKKEGIFRIFSNRLSDKLVKEEGGPVVTVKL